MKLNAIFASLLIVYGGGASASDRVTPFASLTLSRDDNLLRLDKNESPSLERSDSFSTLAAGINVNLSYSRQNVVLNLSRNQNRYDRYDLLGYDGEDYRAAWNWKLGNHVSGVLGANRSLTQTSFSAFNFTNSAFQLVNNTVTRTVANARADWLFHPRWSVGSSFQASESVNDTQQQRTQDNESDSLELSLNYATPKGAQLGTLVTLNKVDYPNRQVFANSRIDNSYVQNEFSLTGSWPVTGKLATRVRVGYVRREHESLPARDFSGLSFRASADYAITAKTFANLSVFRELSGADEDNANTRLVTGFRLAGVWQINSWFGLRGNAGYERFDYRNDPGFVLGSTPRRVEDNFSGALSLSYSPLRQLTVDVGLQTGSRDSNITNGSFEFLTTFASIRGEL